MVTAHKIQVVGKKLHKCYNLQNSAAPSSIFHIEQVLMYIFTESILHEALLVQRPPRIDSESDKEYEEISPDDRPQGIVKTCSLGFIANWN